MAFSRTYFESVTQKKIVPRIADATFKGCPLAYYLRENHATKLRGGRNIVLPNIIKEANFEWYDNVDVADMEVIEPEQSAQANWHWARVMIHIPETDLDKNGGEEGVIDLMETRRQWAELTMIEGLSDALYGSNSSDSQQMPGLQDLFGASGTAYLDLLDTDVDDYQGKWLSEIVSPLTAGTLNEQEMRRMRGICTKGASKPNFGTCNFPVYNTIWRLAQNDQRFGMEKLANIGFDNVVFEGMPIVPDEHSPGTGYGTADSWLMFLNMDFMQLWIHENKAFASRVFEPLAVQNVWSAGVYLGVSMTTNNRRMHSVEKTINPTS